MKEILQISKEEFYTIGTLYTPKGYGIVRNDFHNVPPTVVASPTFSQPGSLNTCQFFIEDA